MVEPVATGLPPRSLPRIGPALAAAGFHLDEEQVYNHGLLLAPHWRRL